MGIQADSISEMSDEEEEFQIRMLPSYVAFDDFQHAHIKANASRMYLPCDLNKSDYLSLTCGDFFHMEASNVISSHFAARVGH